MHLLVTHAKRFDCIRESDGGVSEPAPAGLSLIENCIRESDGGVSELVMQRLPVLLQCRTGNRFTGGGLHNASYEAWHDQFGD